MTRLLYRPIAACVLALSLLFAGAANAQTKAAPKDAKAKTAAAAPATAKPTAKEIADAQAKGLVWVNLPTKIYHRDGQFYGKTKEGKFMTEAEAQKAGYRSAKPSPIPKKKAAEGKK